MVQQPSYWKVLTRRKQLSQEGGDGESKLNRVLGLYDLTALGVGSTLGAGVYVLAGQIAKDQAGPSVMLSFAIAALASLLAGICYAEFGARVPKAGSAYVYSYVCIGEFAAFVIGWNLILEYMIGTASVCRGISLYLDTLINDTLKTTFAEVAPMNVSFLGSYFDFFACGLVAVFGVALAFGVETSAIANNFCTCLNLSILLFVIIAGSVKANFSNWTIDVDAVNRTEIAPDTDLGMGGFFPFGFTGTLRGAATCFFGFVGFDCIATTGEEVQNPRKNIPRSILLSLVVIFLCYFGVSTVITLMVPYYLQDANAPLPSAFRVVGWNFAMWIVSIGGLVGLLASLFGALFPLPRVMYSMAQDGLMFRVFAQIHPKYRVPVVGSIVAAMLTAIIAGLFDLAQLVNLLSIGTLLAYSVVAISITILRYMDNADTFGIEPQSNGHIDSVNGENGQSNGNGNHHSNANGTNNGHNVSENSLLTSKGERSTFKTVLSQLFNFKREYTPNELSTRIVGTLISVFCILSAGIGLIFMQAYDALITNQIWVLVLMAVLCVLTALVLLCICLQPRELCTRVFTVPLVPLVPAISIFINIYLMLQLDVMTWIRFGVWMVIGIPMFVACLYMYDIKNPANRHPDRIEFERLLKLSSQLHPTNSEEEFMNKLNKDFNTSTSTVIMQYNERSVRSLDEIMDLNDVEDGLKEVKHPNGQICFIEDNESHKSQTSLHRTDEDTEVNFASLKTDTSEEEKSVIALLDNVLETEDDYLNNSQLLQMFDRKTSVDSEMEPSVIRSTTVATVHSSSNSDSSKSSKNSIDSGTGTYEEKLKIAQELVDQIFNSQDLWSALEKHQQNLLQSDALNENHIVIELINNDVDEINMPKNANGVTTNDLKRVQSVESLISIISVEDPLHSEKFRNKLSKLIVKPPKPKSLKEASKPEASIQEIRPNLKHSQSEADVRALVLKAIKDCHTDIDEKAKSKSAIRQDEQYIPKPPKFDPVLYKTINSLSRPKERASLEKLLKNDEFSTNDKTLTERNELQNNELSFKQKLEAILKQGPSHKTQARPDIAKRRPKSVESLQLTEDDPTSAKINNKSVNNLITTSSLIEEPRKSLTPVKETPIEYYSIS